MNVVLIYGPPGVGKLTVATELAGLTGYKLFDNHASIDVIRRVFDFNDEPFWPLVRRLRRDVIEAGCAHGVDVITTGAYIYPDDTPAIESGFGIVEKYGSRLLLTHLTCDIEMLEQRVQSEGRANKMHSLEIARNDMARHDLLHTHPRPGEPEHQQHRHRAGGSSTTNRRALRAAGDLMNLVYIYGPPGVGKLTVARELSRLTGYGLFHNHLTVDCVKPVFEFGTDAFWQTVYKLRLTVMEEAARQDVSLIFTNVYEHPHDLPQAMSRFESVEGQGGRVCPVRLYCSLEELDRRIESESRIEMGKLASVEAFHKSTRMEDVTTPIPGRESLSIDNTEVAPDEAARRIVEHYGLPLL